MLRSPSSRGQVRRSVLLGVVGILVISAAVGVMVLLLNRASAHQERREDDRRRIVQVQRLLREADQSERLALESARSGKGWAAERHSRVASRKRTQARELLDETLYPDEPRASCFRPQQCRLCR